MVKSKSSKTSESLRLAFKHEIRLDDYFNRITITSLTVACAMAIFTSFSTGPFNPNLVIPAEGSWTSRNPAGQLYIETWANILVNSLQAGFSIWGAQLFFLGIFRIFTAQKFVFGCFSLAAAFIGFAYFLPSWTQTLLGMLAEKCPFLIE